MADLHEPLNDTYIGKVADDPIFTLLPAHS